MRRGVIALLCLAVGLVLGCGNEVPTGAPTTSSYEKARAAAAKKGKKNKKIAKKKVQKDKDEKAEEATFASGLGGFRYNPAGKRDPFRSFVKESVATKNDGPRGPLEYFALSQLDLVAVILSDKKPRALINDPSGKGYIVGLGTPIGKLEGKVIALGDGSMTVQETQVDYSGVRTARNVEMKIRHKEGG